MEAKPNILLITSDQMRKDCFGIYANRFIKTPNVDSLAQEAIIFDNHFTQNPVCMPARWSIFTGRYPSIHSVRENGVQYCSNEITLARVLKQYGYVTAAMGKMHFASQLLYQDCEDENWPEDDFGFSVKNLSDDCKKGQYLSWLKSKDTKAYEYILNQGQGKITEDFKSPGKRPYKLAPQIISSNVSLELHQTSWIADRTIEFIEHAATPFFIWCSFVDPHHPFDPPEPYASMYEPEKMAAPIMRDGEHTTNPPHFKEMFTGSSPGNEKYEFNRISKLGWQTVKAKYYGMVSLIDHNIGRIVNRLKASGLFNNTIIIITSDHGELLGDHGLLFKGPFHYDGLIHVPLIIKWGNRICGGSRIGEITQHIDLMPSILNLSGIPVPRGVQGKSLQQLLNHNGEPCYEFALIEHHSHDWGLNIRTIRSKSWRLTYYAGKTYGELYNLKKDPHELYNLWDNTDYSNIKAELLTKLLDKLILNEDLKQERMAKY